MSGCFTLDRGVLALGNLPLSCRVTPLYSSLPSPDIPTKPSRDASPRQVTCVPIMKKKNHVHSLKINFAPSQSIPLLAKISSGKHRVAGHPGFILQTITGFHRPELDHYYRLICHLTPTPVLSYLLNRRFLSSRRRCQASPVTALVPARDPTLNHNIGLTEYWTSRYFGRLSPLCCRIRFACAVYL